jgi:hypothetical protein
VHFHRRTGEGRRNVMREECLDAAGDRRTVNATGDTGPEALSNP